MMMMMMITSEQPVGISCKSILRRDENRSARRKTLGIRLRSTNNSAQAGIEPRSLRWEARMLTTAPPWHPVSGRLDCHLHCRRSTEESERSD